MKATALVSSVEAILIMKDQQILSRRGLIGPHDDTGTPSLVIIAIGGTTGIVGVAKLINTHTSHD